MGGIIQPGGAGTWTFITPVSIGSQSLDANDGSAALALSNANLDGASYAIVQVGGYITWAGAGAISSAFFAFYVSVTGGLGDVVLTAQKYATTAYQPDANAGANYGILQQVIMPIYFDPALRTYSIAGTLSAQSDTVVASGIVIASFDFTLIGTIANLSQP